MSKIIKLGFTGTSVGMTEMQEEAVRRFLRSNRSRITRAGHGDCVGSDEKFDSMLSVYTEVEIFPPEDSKLRAFCDARTIHPEKPYLERNRDIGDWCDELLATPHNHYPKEEIRSGTWSTVRYVRKLGKPIHIVWPDGRLTDGRKQVR